MSRTHAAHLPTDRYAERSKTRRRLRTEQERHHKSAKADRKGIHNELREAVKSYR